MDPRLWKILVHRTNSQQPSLFLQADDVIWSPSSQCGLSTPPPEPTAIVSAPSLSRCSSVSGELTLVLRCVCVQFNQTHCGVVVCVCVYRCDVSLTSFLPCNPAH